MYVHMYISFVTEVFEWQSLMPLLAMCGFIPKVLQKKNDGGAYIHTRTCVCVYVYMYIRIYCGVASMFH